MQSVVTASAVSVPRTRSTAGVAAGADHGVVRTVESYCWYTQRLLAIVGDVEQAAASVQREVGLRRAARRSRDVARGARDRVALARLGVYIGQSVDQPLARELGDDAIALVRTR